MPTITVRNVSPKVVQSLKASRRHNRSMEQEVRELLEGYVAERRAVLDQMRGSWSRQAAAPPRAKSTHGSRWAAVTAVVDTNVVESCSVPSRSSTRRVTHLPGRDPAAPAHWEAELANVVWMAVRTGLLPAEEGPRAPGLARRLGIESVPRQRCVRAPSCGRSRRALPSTTRCSSNWPFAPVSPAHVRQGAAAGLSACGDAPALIVTWSAGRRRADGLARGESPLQRGHFQHLLPGGWRRQGPPARQPAREAANHRFVRRAKGALVVAMHEAHEPTGRRRGDVGDSVSDLAAIGVRVTATAPRYHQPPCWETSRRTGSTSTLRHRDRRLAEEHGEGARRLGESTSASGDRPASSGTIVSSTRPQRWRAVPPRRPSLTRLGSRPGRRIYRIRVHRPARPCEGSDGSLS